MKRYFWAFVLTALPVLAADQPPIASVRPVTDTYYGTPITDPYRWMENSKDPEFVSWMKAQSDYTRATLDRIPGRAELLRSITRVNNATTNVNSLQFAQGLYFYLKTKPGDNGPKLYVRKGLKGPEKLLVDPDKLSQSQSAHFALDYFQPSLNGKYLAYGLSEGGSENSVLHVMEVASRKEVETPITRTQYTSISWLPDNRSFFYRRLQKTTNPAAKYLDSRAYFHVLGTDADKDPVIFGRGFSKATIGPADFPSVMLPSPTAQDVLGIVGHGVQNELTVYTVPLAQLKGAQTPWRKLVDVEDAVTGLDVQGGEVYLLTHKDASRYKVIKTSLRQPDLTHAQVVVPPGEAVITGIQAAQDALYVKFLDGGPGRLARVPFASGKVEPVQLPFVGAIQELITTPTEPGALLRIGGWTKAAVYFAYKPKTQQMVNTQLKPPSPVDFSGIEAIEVKAKAPDGTLIPLSIIYQKGLVKDGSHPTLMEGYGAYGISQEPGFNPTLLPWLQAGGVFAVAHVRGGGEYGEDWHLAGQKANKLNTITDFIACGQYLIDQGYTRPEKLAGQGGSAGGILIGGAITQRPDLFGAAISNVGVADNLRIELTPNGPANIPEFGSTKTEAGFKALYAMSSYHQVQENTPYPAVLLTTGINDPRVDSWQAAKMTARLQAASKSSKPVLLRVDYDAGHGIGSTRSQQNQELADEYSFLFWQLGVSGYQP